MPDSLLRPNAAPRGWYAPKRQFRYGGTARRYLSLGREPERESAIRGLPPELDAPLLDFSRDATKRRQMIRRRSTIHEILYMV